MTGKPVTKSILTPLVAITKANMNDPKVASYIHKSGCRAIRFPGSEWRPGPGSLAVHRLNLTD